MRIVLDANIFVAASMSPKGICGSLLVAILKNPGAFELIMTDKVLNVKDNGWRR